MKNKTNEELEAIAEGDGMQWVSINYHLDEVGLDGSFTVEQLEAIIELKRRSMERTS